ncbi:hypothetical protein CXU01_11180 [Akkermansia muciniphila]|nr:hypothetical protein CXU01_11180 [Akkermansia muciniphila]
MHQCGAFFLPCFAAFDGNLKKLLKGMNPIVQAYVENYDLPDLQGMLREKLAILEGRKEITGASTGGGTSYTAQETMNLKDHIACLQEAIMVKKMEEGDFSGLAAADDGVREVRFDHTITRF